MKSGVAAWTRAHEAAEALRPPRPWRAALAARVREASRATFVSVLTCPPSRWYELQHDSDPGEYAAIVTAVRQQFQARIDAVGEGWRFGLTHHGAVYSPIDAARDRTLAEELRTRLLAPSGIDGYLTTMVTDRDGRLLAMIVLGSDRPSSELLDAHRTSLAAVGAAAANTLETAVELATACGARTPGGREPRLGQLSERERQVAQLASEGHSALNIAAHLDIKESTVAVHLRRIHRKLGVHSRVELTRVMLGYE